MPKADTIAIVRRPRVLLEALFGVRYLLGRYGDDPCDEWCIEDIMNLPDGLFYIGGKIQFECNVCEKWTEWPADISEFEIGHYANVCGGSPRCCP